MSLSPNEKYPGATEADPNYKDSKFKDNNPSTTNNGSPLKALDRNEQLALQEAMMNAAGFDYNGVVDTPQNSQMFNAYKAALSNGANLLSNHNFIVASPDDSQPAPSATPTSYPPGFQIFSGVFANETTGILNLTYIDGRVSFSGGDFYMAAPNTGALENITEFVASVADFDGKPRTRGVSFALVGNEYRVTVGVDALEDESANETLLGSVKFEQGGVATGHEVVELVSTGNIHTYADVSYRNTPNGNSAIDNMVSGIPVPANVGDKCGLPGMQWERVSLSVPSSLDDFKPLMPVTPSAWGLNTSGFNNADAIQAALEYCYDNNTSFIAPAVDVDTDKTIFLPNFSSFDTYQVIDFAGMRIRPDDTVFKPMQSGKRIGGVWESAMSEPLQTYMTFNTKLTGLVFVRDDPETKDGRVALELKDWHQSCELETLVVRNFQTALDSYNNFYLNYGNLKLQNAGLASGERTGIGFIFRTAINLNNIKQLVSQNVDTGYIFDGLITALHIETISLEGQNHGLVTTGEVRGMTVSGTYGEYNIIDSEDFFDFQGPVYNVEIDGCYFTSSNANTWVIKSQSSPRSAIMFGKNNNLGGTLDETRVFENKGYGYRTLGSPTESFGTDGSNLIYRESDLGVGTVVEKYAVDIYTGGDTYSVARVHNEIIPANYSGRMTRGFTSNRQPGLFNPVKDEVNGTLTLNTKVLYSSSQLIYFTGRVADFIGTKIWSVWINHDEIKNFDGTDNTDISFTVDTEGFLEITVSGISPNNAFNFTGGEIRVI